MSAWTVQGDFELAQILVSISYRSDKEDTDEASGKFFVPVRVPTSSGYHGKPGKFPNKSSMHVNSWNSKKPE